MQDQLKVYPHVNTLLVCISTHQTIHRRESAVDYRHLLDTQPYFHHLLRCRHCFALSSPGPYSKFTVWHFLTALKSTSSAYLRWRRRARGSALTQLCRRDGMTLCLISLKSNFCDDNARGSTLNDESRITNLSTVLNRWLPNPTVFEIGKESLHFREKRGFLSTPNQISVSNSHRILICNVNNK